MQIARRKKRLNPVEAHPQLPPRWHIPAASCRQQDLVDQPSHRAGSPPDIDKPKQAKPLLPPPVTESS